MSIKDVVKSIEEEKQKKEKTPGIVLPKFVIDINKSKLPPGVALPADLLPENVRDSSLPAGICLPKNLIDS